jgi:hypothetical protein
MVDAQDLDPPSRHVDAVHHPVGPSPCREQPGEIASKLVPYPKRLVAERSEQELDHRGGGLLRETSQAPLSRWCDDDRPAAAAHGGPR